MDWVNSAGGPLICAEADVAARWMGIDGLSAPDPQQRSDYDRACSTREYLETMACDAGYVLILGDAPLQSSFFRTDSGDLVIARWVYAQSSEGAEKLLKRCGGGRAVAPEIPFDVKRGPLVLFDSVIRGAEADDQAGPFAFAHCQKTNVQRGSYRVTTEMWQPEREFKFILHRLRAE